MNRHARQTSFAFTLIELLVVITIIGILAAMLFPVFGRIRGSAEKASCLNNLHQIGLALQQYIQEYDTLPGPLYVGQGAGYYWTSGNSPGGGALASYLAPYLSLQRTNKWQRADIFVCPGWRRYAPSQSNTNNPGPTYIRNNSFPGIADPWGYPNPYTAPAAFNSIPNPASSWALKDADQVEFTGVEPGWKGNLPTVVVHGDIRNFLFLDGHSESLRAQ